jgi:hypothetical protein
MDDIFDYPAVRQKGRGVMTPDAERVSRIITEKMGLCWHEWEWIPGGGKQCKNCKINPYGPQSNFSYFPINPIPPNIDWTAPERLCDLIRWARAQEWWPEFIDWRCQQKVNGCRYEGCQYCAMEDTDQPIFATNLVEFWEGGNPKA